MSDTPVRDERMALMQTAQTLIRLLHETNAKINHAVNELVAEADRLLPAVADEREGLTPTQRKELKYITSGPVKDMILKPVVMVAPGKRACSICRKPGHRATTCPEAHLARVADKARVEARDKKRRKK